MLTISPTVLACRAAGLRRSAFWYTLVAMVARICVFVHCLLVAMCGCVVRVMWYGGGACGRHTHVHAFKRPGAPVCCC